MASIEEQAKYLASVLKRDKLIANRVTILIGQAAKLFKRFYKDEYHTITTAEEVRKFISYYSVPDDKPLVFEDLSLMTPSVQAYLLKFIEEPPRPLVILASLDNLSPVILSRCKNVIKVENTVEHGETPLGVFVKDNTDAESQGLDNKSSEQIFKECSDFLYYQELLNQNTHKSKKTMLKYISLLQ